MKKEKFAQVIRLAVQIKEASFNHKLAADQLLKQQNKMVDFYKCYEKKPIYGCR